MTRPLDQEPEPAMSISEQAAYWWALLHSEGASSTDHLEFGQWVARSPERVESYLQTARLMRALKARSVRWPGTPAEILIREAKASPPDALQLPSSSTLLHAPPSPARATKQDQSQSLFKVEVTQKARLPRPMLWGTAAALLIVAGSTWLLMAGPQVYMTKFGEQRSVLLDDGSRVTLNTASKIEVDLRKERRVIRLRQGEALFEVAHDTSRPFDVHAGTTVLRAVGTQFNVDMRLTQTTVTVLEGRVAVVTDSAAAAAGSAESPSAPSNTTEIRDSAENSHSHQALVPRGPLILAAAERVVITSSGPSAPQHVANLAAATSWTQRQLVFDNRPLSEVAEEFNRYNRGRIVIDSDELRGQQVTGVFQSDDPASFLSFLSNIQDVEIREAGDGTRMVSVHGQAAGVVGAH
jgi:transmembrane sensor